MNILRHITQVCVTLFYNANLVTGPFGKYMDLPGQDACVPGYNCMHCRYSLSGCPLGTMQRTLKDRHPYFSVELWGILIFFGFLIGRMVCGWGCPIGAMQGLLHKIPSPKIKKSTFTYKLTYLKYVMLIVFVIGVPLVLSMVNGRGISFYCEYLCPVLFLQSRGLTALVTGNLGRLGDMFSSHRFYLSLALVLSAVVIYRPFCRFLCPLGAFYSFFNKFAVFGMKVDADKCIGCDACIRQCKMDCQKVGDRECIACGKCRGVCPTKAITLGNRYSK